MMISKIAKVLGLVAISVAPFARVNAQEAEADEASVNRELEDQLLYVEALVNNGYPDFAEPLVAEAKKKWPDSEARFFAIEVRSLLSLGKFDEAEKRIASLPDRKSTKYWAARLEVANNYFGRNMKAECLKIYSDFFAAFPKPPKDIRKFYFDAKYAYGQLLFSDGKYEDAANAYQDLLAGVKGDDWCNLASETAKMYLKLADESKAAKREGFLKSAEKIIDKLLWHLDQPVYFGLGVSMKAHVAEIRGKLDRAAELIEEYKPTLEDLHRQLVEADPDGSLGFLRLSPLPECLYLQAKMMWKAVQEEAKKPKRDDEKIASHLFGPKVSSGSKKRNGKGAFNYAINVFIKYEMSPWAAPAGELSEEIKEFVKTTYGKEIKTQITSEQLRKVRAAQFKAARDLFLADKYRESIAAYYDALAKYPEIPEAVDAVANIISALQDLCVEEQDEAKKLAYRQDADAVEAYLAERFAGNPDRSLMIAAGNAVFGAAAKEQERGEKARADWLYAEFYNNYREHPNAPALAASKAGESQKDGNWRDAISKWQVVENLYTNSMYYVPALSQLSYCYGKLGDAANEIAYINRYLKLETVQIRKLQAQMQLAQMYQKDGLAVLAGASTNETEEAVTAAEKRGSAQIIRAIKEFTRFANESEAAIKDPGVTKVDREKYLDLREAALFLVGDCYGRINRPEKALPALRAHAAESYEAYIKAFPEGKYVKNAYVKLGSIYTALGDMAKSKDALDRLSKQYPESEEAKNAMPRLAKNLVEMGLQKEGTEVYAGMLSTDGKYSARQFVDAGDALIDAKSWELANQAFEKAIRIAGTNSPTLVATARLGEAKCLFRQGSLVEARDALDLFLNGPSAKSTKAIDAYYMLIEVASAQGRTEKDDVMRGKHFGAAVGAVKKVRTYLSRMKDKQPWEVNAIDLMSGDVLVRRMKAEEDMGLKEAAAETCGRAASTFQVFIQAHGPTESCPFDQMSEGDRANLERAYASMIPLLSKMGADQADRVIAFGREYMNYFPNGESKTLVGNCMNQAKADLPSSAASATEAPATEAPAPAAPAAEAPAAETTTSQGE